MRLMLELDIVVTHKNGVDELLRERIQDRFGSLLTELDCEYGGSFTLTEEPQEEKEVKHGTAAGH